VLAFKQPSRLRFAEEVRPLFLDSKSKLMAAETLAFTFFNIPGK
jgi:hypothetical protein